MSSEKVTGWLSQISTDDEIHSPPSPRQAPASPGCLEQKPHLTPDLSSIPHTPTKKRKRDSEALSSNKAQRSHNPLTRGALRKLDNKMPPQTPNKSDNGSSTDMSKTPKQPKNLKNTLEDLAEVGMLMNNKKSLTERQEWHNEVREMFQADRGSAMKLDSAQKHMDQMEEMRFEHESEIFRRGNVEGILKMSRMVETQKRTADEEVVKAYEDYADAELKMVERVGFTKKFLPDGMSAKTERALGLTDPCPDYTFGIVEQEIRFAGSLLIQEVRAIAKVVQGMDHPFLVIESKSCQQTIEWAEVQSLRDGSTMINAQLMLQEKAGVKDRVGKADALAFSLPWAPALARLYYHWAEKVWDEDIEDWKWLFHMHRLRDYSMTSLTDWPLLRCHAHNIMDYGVTKHKTKYQDYVADMLKTVKDAHKEGKK